MGLIVLLVASACRVDTTVDIRVDDDGSGRVAYTVVANAEAVSLLVDDPTDLRFDDLAAAGWITMIWGDSILLVYDRFT